MGSQFVGGVASWFELEGGVLDVEVPNEAVLQLIEQLQGVRGDAYGCR